MDEVGRLLTLLALASGALTLLGGAVVWTLDEERRIRRSLAKVMGATPQAVLTARGRGRGIGFDFTGDSVVTTWDTGAWCLVYRGHELMGAELIVDDQVAARVHRIGAGRPLLQLALPQDLVRLRFIFDDPRWPDFEIDLWRAQDAGRRDRLQPAEAMQEANRWLARMEALLRRPAPARAPMVAAAPPLAAAPPCEDEDEEVEAARDLVT